MSSRFIVPVQIQELEEGGFLAICDAIQGCHAEGGSPAEALYNLEDVARILVEFQMEDGVRFSEDTAEVPLGPTTLYAQLLVSVD